jgi:hypothetical protein
MEKPIMIPAAAPFLILSSRIMHQKEVLIAQLLQKIPSQWKNVYSKAKFYRWHKPK